MVDLASRPFSPRPASREGEGATPVELSPLPEMVGYALRRAQVAVFRRFAAAFADLDIRPSQLGVLTAIGNNPGLNQSAVGEALGIKRANIVTLVDGLAARGLVTRDRVTSDRRSHALRLTPAGVTLLAEAQRREAAHEQEITAGIGEGGRRTLLDLLAAVTASAGEGQEGEPE